MGRIHTDRALCIDLELTCWKGEPPQGMAPEIIEIGIVEADMRSLEITRHRSYFVRPKISEVGAFCTELTGITREKLASEGKPFNEAINTLRKDFGPSRKALVTWGDDWGGMQRECELYGVANPFPLAAVVNIGLAASLLAGENRGLGLYEAMEARQVEEVGQRHRGVDDARNTMQLFLSLAKFRDGLRRSPFQS